MHFYNILTVGQFSRKLSHFIYICETTFSRELSQPEKPDIQSSNLRHEVATNVKEAFSNEHTPVENGTGYEAH